MSDTQQTPATDTPQHATEQPSYTPVFNEQVRTVIYVFTLIVGLVGLGVSAFGDPQVGAYISSAAGIIAAAFGTTYNPMRLAGK